MHRAPSAAFPTLSASLTLCLAVACAQPSPPRGPAPAPSIDYNVEDVLALADVGDGAPFYEAARYDPAITPPAECLGHPLGERPATPERIVACFHRWAEQSPRVSLARYALSHEGRELIRVVITTPENLARLEQIKSDLGRLADPRQLSSADADAIIERTPAVGWFAYSIHGDEMSGSDAALAFAYHLIAGGAETASLLSDVVVVVDPSMNPDGRRRTINALETMRSLVPSDNYANMERAEWPGGRGNHYLFDLNRDWIVGVHPETRGRWAEILSFHPQLLVDAHEMGELDTFLFSPKNKPFNPNFPAAQMKWYQVFSADIAAAFDRKGWAYYTREWSDGWFPGYGSTWGPINGAIGYLFEQSSTNGLSVRRPSGTRVTYHESIRGHALASLVNLATLARHRAAVLRDYLAVRRRSVERKGRAFVLVPGKNPDRERAFLAILLRQHIEVYRATAPFSAGAIESALGRKSPSAEFPAGSYIVFEAQPQGDLMRALLEFDPRQDAASLTREREELERNGRSRIYDVTAWNLGHAFALDAYWTAVPKVAVSPLSELESGPDGVLPPAANKAAYAWLVDGREDGSPVFAAHALALGLTVHVADEAFDMDGRAYARGSVLVRISENPKDTPELVAKAANVAEVPVHRATTGRAPGDGIDLGGRHFRRLERPRVALLANSPIAGASFGHVWHHLDRELKIPITMLDLQRLGAEDLRRYNVIVVPDTWASFEGILADKKQALSVWIQQGGTLIAMGRAAAGVAKADLGLSQVRLRRDVLDTLAVYDAAAERSLASRAVAIDAGALWNGEPDEQPDTRGHSGKPIAPAVDSPKAEPPAGSETIGGKSGDAAKQVAEQRDVWERRFAPRGAMLRGLVDQETWVTAGATGEMPVLFRGDSVFLAPDSVRVAVRLAGPTDVRLSGLLWPEARARIANSAYLTVENAGRGHIILFAYEPVYRGLTRGTARLLSNAVIYSPGLGADQPNAWQH